MREGPITNAVTHMILCERDLLNSGKATLRAGPKDCIMLGSVTSMYSQWAHVKELEPCYGTMGLLSL